MKGLNTAVIFSLLLCGGCDRIKALTEPVEVVKAPAEADDAAAEARKAKRGYDQQAWERALLEENIKYPIVKIEPVFETLPDAYSERDLRLAFTFIDKALTRCYLNSLGERGEFSGEVRYEFDISNAGKAEKVRFADDERNKNLGELSRCFADTLQDWPLPGHEDSQRQSVVMVLKFEKTGERDIYEIIEAYKKKHGHAHGDHANDADPQGEHANEPTESEKSP